MKKSIYLQLLTSFSTLILFVANLSVGAASTIWSYQPKLPEELKSDN